MICAALALQGHDQDLFYFLGAIIGVGLLTGLNFLYQLLVWLCVRRVFRPHPAWAAVFLLPGLLFFANIAWKLTPQGKAGAILARGRLAPLPSSATEIKIYGWHGLFSGEDYLRFRATADDVEKFLRESPSLRGAEAESYTVQHQLRQFPDDGMPPADDPHFKRHRYHHPGKRAKEWWWSGELRDRGRIHPIPAEGFHNWGQVIYDEAAGVVFINVIFS